MNGWAFAMLAFAVLYMVPGTQAQNWGPDDPPPKDSAGISVADEPTPAPTVSVEMRKAAKELADRPGLTIKQRRAMGITFRNLRLKLREMHDAGELEGKTRAEISVEMMNRLVQDNPKAFADPSLDFDSILAFIERLLPILLFLLALL